MKLFLFASLLLGAPAAWAQTAPAMPSATASAAVVPYRYCALVAYGPYFSLPNRLVLDYGQEVIGAPIEPEMAGMAKNISGSRSVIDALSYLSRHGWELLNVTNAQSNINGNSTYSSHCIDSETRYLLRRRSQ